jgi:cbb3-type cytochrome oxidase subunit 3
MELNVLRSAVTVLSLFGFLAIVAWAWSANRAKQFAEAERLPLQED